MQCYLCKNKEFQLITDKIRYDAPRKIYQFSHCGLVFLHPQMSPEEERLFYEKEYGEIYSNEKGTTPAQLFTAWIGDAALYFEWIKKYINPDSGCLELGCASGYFLETIKPHVKQVSGIETHTLLKKYCQDLGIRMFDSLTECADNSFDTVFMFFLLEHMGDPLKYLQEVKRVLKDRGKIVIVVPNVDDALFRLYDILGFRTFYFTPAHLFYYSKATLAGLIQKAGFSQIRARTGENTKISLTRYGTEMDVIPFSSEAKFDIANLTYQAMAELLLEKPIGSTGEDGKRSLELVIGLHISDENENTKVAFPLSDWYYQKDVQIA